MGAGERRREGVTPLSTLQIDPEADAEAAVEVERRLLPDRPLVALDFTLQETPSPELLERLAALGFTSNEPPTTSRIVVGADPFADPASAIGEIPESESYRGGRFESLSRTRRCYPALDAKRLEPHGERA